MKNRYKVNSKNFSRTAFDDCARYCKASVLERFIDGAVIEIQLRNPSMRKEALNLYLNRWKSCGFELTKL